MKRFASYSWAIQSVALIAMLLLVLGQEPRAVSSPVTEVLLGQVRGDLAWAAPAPNGCARAPQEFKNVDCSKETSPSTCQSGCFDKLQKYERNELAAAQLNESHCGGENCSGLDDTGETNQFLKFKSGGKVTAKAAECFGHKVNFNKVIKENSGRPCQEALKACKNLTSDDNKDIIEKNNTACKNSNKEAKDTEKDQGDKKKAVEDQNKKNEDNAKKEGSGGGMPQMPQMPQQKEDPKEDPPTQPDTNTGTASTVATASKTEIENSKLGGDNKISPPTIGFESSTSTNTSTIQNFGGGGGGFNSKDDFKGKGFESPTGANSSGAVPGNGPVGTGGGGGGIQSSNGTGASQVGPEGKAEPNAANPYEVQTGGGGKLGGPKGMKSGGESDSALDAGAKDAFKSDVGGDKPADAPANGEVAGSGSEEGDGYSIFKMINVRYAELKKRGSI